MPNLHFILEGYIIISVHVAQFTQCSPYFFGLFGPSLLFWPLCLYVLGITSLVFAPCNQHLSSPGTVKNTPDLIQNFGKWPVLYKSYPNTKWIYLPTWMVKLKCTLVNVGKYTIHWVSDIYIYSCWLVNDNWLLLASGPTYGAGFFCQTEGIGRMECRTKRSSRRMPNVWLWIIYILRWHIVLFALLCSNITWRITPVCKWLVNPIYEPCRAIWKGSHNPT